MRLASTATKSHPQKQASVSNQYQNDFRAHISQCLLLLIALRDNPNMTYEQKLKALHTIYVSIPMLKRAVMFIENTKTEYKI